MKIGYRTLKTAVGAALAIAIAQLIGLHNFASAGIIVILCVQVTKKRSLETARARFAACVVAVGFAALFFTAFGYHPWTIGLLLLLFIPVTVRLKINEGIATSSVIILHLYAAKDITWGLVANEILLVAVGIGVALLMNMYMPSAEKELKEYQRIVEDLFRIILKEIVRYLRTNELDWDGKELPLAAETLEKAKKLAMRHADNQLWRNEDEYVRYFRMRERQLEIIEHMLPLVTSLVYTVEQRMMVADFIDELSDAIHPGNTADRFLRRLAEMREQFKAMPLPKTREQFEERAALFHLVRELERYLIIKSEFHPGNERKPQRLKA
ncbi:aromatic acid exporter family protein [Geobacillus sp. G4]|uniref:aromatic acid exporter family protein n=1 Tax=Geobacillus sp. G4 TaxID=3169691 RepID=UPI003338557E